MENKVFHDATTGILIGLTLSIIFLYPLTKQLRTFSPNCHQFMREHQVHGLWALLYYTVIFQGAGLSTLPLSFGSRLFADKIESSLDLSSLSFLMLLGFVP